MTGLKIHPHPDPLPSRKRERIGESREGGKIHRGFPVLLFGFLINTFRNDGQKVIEAFRGDEHGDLFLHVIFCLFLLSFCVFVFWGVYKGGAAPFIVDSPSP